MSEDFWNLSWKAIGRERIAEYARSISPAPDDIIRLLQQHNANLVCDAGCGCGIYAAKLLRSGFTVAGFDISADAVEIAQESAPMAAFKIASVCSTGYPSGSFDGIVCRDVLDHIGRQDARLAVQELCRILKPDGILIVTLDAPDDEYYRETHTVNADGDFVYTARKWRGMVFHPYSRAEITQIIPPSLHWEIFEANDGLLLVVHNCGTHEAESAEA